MPPKLVRTDRPGVFKRGSRYTYLWRDASGRQKQGTASTKAEAVRARSQRIADVSRGESFDTTKIKAGEFFLGWSKRYLGKSRGIKPRTKQEYERDLRRYFLPFIGEKRKLASIQPADIAQFVAWLCDPDEQGQRTAKEAKAKGKALEKVEPVELADQTVRRILAPIKAGFSTAVQEGLIRSNPAREITVPHRRRLSDEAEEDVRVFTREQLRDFLANVDKRYRLMFEFLAATGLRISELAGLEWRHLALDTSKPHVNVRQQIYRGEVETVKSKHGRRSVPLTKKMASALRKHRMGLGWPEDSSPVFPSTQGTPLRRENIFRRVLKPVAEDVGAEWAGFHTLRHTCASLLFARGMNIVQVQKWLGHASPTFTLNTYVHALTSELSEPLDITAEASRGVSILPAEPTNTSTRHAAIVDGEPA